VSPPGGSGTTSGQVLEALLIPVAQKNHYQIESQVWIGAGLGGGKHRLDALLTADNAEKIAVSLKWQGGPGSVDEKVPYEVVKLLTLMDEHAELKRAYIIIGGNGFRPRLVAYYRSGDLCKYVPAAGRVKIVSIDEFMTLCQRREL